MSNCVEKGKENCHLQKDRTVDLRHLLKKKVNKSDTVFNQKASVVFPLLLQDVSVMRCFTEPI